jgi:hypothetical protein
MNEVILTRLRVGPTRLTHGILLQGEDAPMCAHCDSPLSVVHIYATVLSSKKQETYINSMAPSEKYFKTTLFLPTMF